MSNTLKFSLVMFFGLIIFGIAPAFATDVTDSSPWQNTKNYAMLPVRVLDCSPYGGDSDDDGICDNWESNSGSNPGLHINFVDNTQGTAAVNYRYDITCVVGNTIANDPTGYTVCPSPTKKDIYVELDWMSNQAPNPQAIADVVKAFDNQGIALHVQYGENPSASSGDIGLHYCDVRMMARNNPATNTGLSCSSSTLNYQGYPYLKQNRFGTIDERAGNTSYCPNSAIPTNAGTVSNPNSYNCLTAKRQVFHYGMLVDYQFGSTLSSGWSEVVGNDFVVSLGSFVGGVGSIDEQEGAIMHELGHNFGLHHGGEIPPTGVEDDDNCKPNYPSIMSYTYQFRENNDICRPLDYSNSALASLNEQSLTDSNVGSFQYPSTNPPPPTGTAPGQPLTCPTSGERSIWWSTPNGIKSSTTGIVNDWNQNTASPYNQNINNLGVTGCSSSATSTLDGFNDWNYINTGNSITPHPLNFRTSTNFYQSVVSGNDTNTELGPLGQNVTEITSDAVKGFRGHHLNDLLDKLQPFASTQINGTNHTIGELMNDTIIQNNNNNAWNVYLDLKEIKGNLPPVAASSTENRTTTLQYIDSEINSFAVAGTTVPEFGPVAAVILAISFISIMIISKARFRVGF